MTSSLTLLCGPANSGKVRTILDRFRRDSATSGAWLVVPTRSDVARAKRELANLGVLVGGSVGTFHNLVREIAAETQIEAIQLADVVEIGRVINSLRSRFPA